MNARHCKRGKDLVLASGILTALLLTCTLAHAQPWLPDRQYTEGPGFQVGKLEIHPGLAARAGYDTNVFASDGRNNREVSSGIVSITPHVNISTRGQTREAGRGDAVTAPPKLRLNSGLAGELLYYTTDEPGVPSINAEVDFDGALEIMPERVFSAEIEAAYKRSIRPFTESVGPGQNYIRNNINGGAILKFQSRGGVLTGAMGYRPSVDIFDSDSPFDYLNNLTHVAPVNVAWKFLPHTALLYDSEVRFRRYFDPVEESPDAPIFYTDSTAFRNRLGVNGALTNTIALRLMAGAAFGFYEQALDVQIDEYQEPIGQAALTWTFGGRANRLQLSYEHEVQGSFVGNWVKRDRGDIELSLNLLSALALRFEVGGGRYEYGNMVARDGVTPLGQDMQDFRKDLRVDGAVRGEYRFTNWLAVMGDFVVTVSDTDFAYETTGIGRPGEPDPVIVDPANYTKFEVFGGLRAFY